MIRMPQTRRGILVPDTEMIYEKAAVNLTIWVAASNVVNPYFPYIT